MSPALQPLVWINASFADPSSTRGERRRQVMQKVAQRRRLLEPSTPRPNRRQVPVFVPNASQLDSPVAPGEPEAPTRATDEEYLAKPRQSQTSSDTEPHPPHARAGRALLRVMISTSPSVLAACNLDFQDFAALTSHEIGRHTRHKLLSTPSNISHALGRDTRSYAHHIPQYYNRSVVIRDAVDCVVARVRSVLSPDHSEWESLALSTYAKALTSLQSAINHSMHEPTVEMLCAAQILGLFELLNADRQDAWTRHTVGAISIIKLRGPRCYCTDFERDLLVSMMGPIVTEAILNNETCFLDEPAWTATLQSMAADTAHGDGVLIHLLTIITKIPRLFRDVTTAVCHVSPPQIAATELINRARHIRSLLCAWCAKYNLAAVPPSPLESRFSRPRILSYVATIYINRLITCVHWSNTTDIIELEQAATQSARIVRSLIKEAVISSPRDALLLAARLPMAEATLDTSEEWLQCLREESGGIQELVVLQARTFKRWCHMFGRSTSMEHSSA